MEAAHLLGNESQNMRQRLELLGLRRRELRREAMEDSVVSVDQLCGFRGQRGERGLIPVSVSWEN